MPVMPTRPEVRSPDRTHRGGAIASVAIIAVALAVVLVLTIVTAGRARDDFDTATTGQLVTALRANDLTVCGTQRTTGNHSTEAVTTDVLTLAQGGDCGDGIELQADAYPTADQRDAAARYAEGVDRGRTAGTVWTWHQYTLYLQGDEASGPTGLRDRIVDALDAAGAR